jgi:hypothetical protein
MLTPDYCALSQRWHNIALENPAALAQAYLEFFAGG